MARSKHVAKILKFLVSALTAGVIVLTTLTSKPVLATLAPNSQIFYVAQGPSTIPLGPTELLYNWVMNSNSTGALNLTDTSDVDEFSPAWSPDGSRIAFIPDSFTPTLTVMNFDGSGRTEIVSGALDPQGPRRR
jgi:hypothetical protein